MYTILVNIYLLAANYIFKSFIQWIDEVSMYTVWMRGFTPVMPKIDWNDQEDTNNTSRCVLIWTVFTKIDV